MSMEEFYEDFKSEHLKELKKEFLNEECENLLENYEIGLLFEEYCQKAFKEFRNENNYNRGVKHR